MASYKRGFLIRQDGMAIKILHLESRRVAPYMRRLQSRFPDHRWSVSERFPLNGSD